MVKFLVRLAVFVASAALGLLVAWLALSGFRLRASGFVTTVAIYSIAQSAITPLFARFAQAKASAFVGGAGIVSTFIALLIASLFGNALTISGIGTWISATIVVWLISAVASIVLPQLLRSTGLVTQDRL